MHINEVKKLPPVERKKYFRRRYYYHQILKGVEGFNPRKRLFELNSLEELPPKQAAAANKLIKEFNYLFQTKLF